MNKKLFSELVESMTQMNEIVRGQRATSRKFDVDANAIKSASRKDRAEPTPTRGHGPGESTPDRYQ
jgi:hypothetical protein